MAQTLTQIEIEDYRATVLTPEAYATYWPQIAVELEKVRRYWEPWWTLDFIQRCQLFGVTVWEVGPPDKTNLFVWTQVSHMPAMNVFQVVLIIGNNVDKCLPHLVACCERAAQMFDCQDLEIVGRRGWGRKLENCREIATVFRRETPNTRLQ